MSSNWEFTNAVEPALQARTIILRSAVSNQSNETAKGNLMDASIRHLFICTRLARKSGSMQIALNNLTALHNAIAPHLDTDAVKFGGYAREEAKCWAALGQRLLAIKKLRYSISLVHSLTEGKDGFSPSQPSEVALVLSRLYRLLGRYVGIERLEQASDVIENYLSAAIEIHDSSNVGSFKELATFADAHYVKSIESRTLEDTTALLNEKLQELASLKEQLRHVAKTDQMCRSLESARRRTELQLENDKTEVNRLTEERSSFLIHAVENYLKVLQLGALERHNQVVFRLSSLWLGNSEDLATNEIVEAHIENVASWKFVELVHQFSAHLGRSTGTDGSDLFQDILFKLLVRLANDHPHHTLPIIFALKNSSPTDLAPSSSSSRSRGGTGNNMRSSEAQMILDSVQSMPKGPARVLELDAVLSGYIEVADKKLAKDASRKPISLHGMKLSYLKDLSSCAIVTKDLPPDPSGKYDKVVTIHRFKSEITLVGGITVPKKIECVGSDGMVYSQLVKGNEDVRQDTVLSRIFKVVDRLLKRNNETRSRKLSIRSYKVLPLTGNSGILEWVNNTRPIGDCMLELQARYNDRDIPPIEARKMLQEEHSRKGADKDTKLRVFQHILSRFKPAFRYFFMERWWKPQDWFDRRQTFVKSCATMSIVGWLVGLGDRHTQNILLDTSTAEVIHIDFGIAFEFGKLLTTPELVPFRLTQNMVDGMGITGVEGTFKKTCEEVLKLLRSEAASYMLITVLDVFRYDPLQKWTIAKSKARRARTLDDADPVTEYSPAVSTSRRVAASHVAPSSTSSSLGRSQLGTESNKEAERCLAIVKSKLANHVSVHCTVNDLVQNARSQEQLSLMFPGWQPFV
ncbi:kinase-like protein [Gonapodya prolifera JEL478]|uniref:Serine/threonine-protein kinase TEL1 n=1 Tax=Gonapodya prolifera (strain JEL478) TaxID=1344416 RepID=A0A139AF56_GONPJ|nr:kinase-like protein [Gonapodya prolifera JEL478]|eukprot:KXS15053.1 kinase-like protein [Gonapodya prolifera JEL478]